MAGDISARIGNQEVKPYIGTEGQQITNQKGKILRLMLKQ